MMGWGGPRILGIKGEMGVFWGIKDELQYGFRGIPRGSIWAIGCPKYSISLKEIAFPASELSKFSPAAR